ncbi:hypothetical protein [Photobacterium sp. 53610]|uniref:hypothetical protein n=1 Tax=Photobacterium sp. 53610 TaxID=3102789 RepID=UPI002EDAB457
MKHDKATIQWLNLLHSSPSFVIKVGEQNESPSVLPVRSVPKDDGEYWVAGETELRNGYKIPSVFRVDTDTGGNLLGVYWKIQNEWWDFQDKPSVLEALALTEEDVFPFDWTYSVSLDEDIFHS